MFLLNPCVLSLLYLKLHSYACIFPGKSVVMHLVRDLIKDTPLIERDTEKERDNKKARHPAGYEPMTSLF